MVLKRGDKTKRIKPLLWYSHRGGINETKAIKKWKANKCGAFTVFQKANVFTIRGKMYKIFWE